MAVDWEFDVREIPKELQRSDYKDFFRVYVSPVTMQTLGLSRGDPCKLMISGFAVGTVLVWETNKGTKTKEIQIPKLLLAFYNVSSRGRASLSKKPSQLTNANTVDCYEVFQEDSRDAPLMESEYGYWAWLLEYELYRAETISPGMVLDGVSVKGQKRSFKIHSVDGSSKASLHRSQADCKVHVMNDETRSDAKFLNIPQGGIGGLEAQIKKLNECISTYSRAENIRPKVRSAPSWRNGIILHGPPGVGLSLLLHQVGEAGWRSVFNTELDQPCQSTRVDEKIATIRNLFANARSAQPSVILIDDLTDFIGPHDSQHSGEALRISRVLRHEMEHLGDCRTLVVATTHSLTKVDQALRRVDGFPEVIEIPVPDTRSRVSILKAQSGVLENTENARIEELASRTHGFVAADLVLLLDVALKMADNVTVFDADRSSLPIIERIGNGDIDRALQRVRPAAIQEAFVEVPETRWSDIGGQEEVKHFLDQAMGRLYKDKPWLRNFKRPSRKGLLLYGPPGCSKTMIARAAATESGHNFIVVKGAEILNMYVGESERRLREYFHLARSVSPSILFLDEFDAIGTDRDSGPHSGLNLVTTLLNEMDGIVELKDVFVLAATNRPDVIDRALTRPGRFDQTLYIGPPDFKARLQIIVTYLQKMDISVETDVTNLAKATNGYSGAEVVNVCSKAIEAAFEDSVAEDEFLKVNHKHFDQAMTQGQRSITPDVLAYFESYRASKRFDTLALS